jgi:hypothetical protein
MADPCVYLEVFDEKLNLFCPACRARIVKDDSLVKRFCEHVIVATFEAFDEYLYMSLSNPRDLDYVVPRYADIAAKTKEAVVAAYNARHEGVPDAEWLVPTGCFIQFLYRIRPNILILSITGDDGAFTVAIDFQPREAD